MKFFHGTSEENWSDVLSEGVLFGRRFVTNPDGTVKETCRCTYLTDKIEEARCYGNVILEVEYNPFDEEGHIKRDDKGVLNNYVPGGWQLRVYEAIPLENIKRIE